MNPRVVRILGSPVHAVDLNAALDVLGRGIRRGVQQFVVAQNPEKVMRSAGDPELAEIVERRATLSTADGVGLVIASRLLGSGPIPRLPGIDLFQALLALAAAEGKRVFLYGSTREVVTRAGRVAGVRYPGLRLAGTSDGFDQDEPSVIQTICQATPDFLFVGLGTPKQEKWIARHLDHLPVELAMGVGGSFDVLAGAVSRAPAWMRRAGLEWLYRLLGQPRRWRRVGVLPIFLWRVMTARPRRRWAKRSRA